MKKLASLTLAAILLIALSFSQSSAFEFPWSAPRQAVNSFENSLTEKSNHKPAPAGAPEPNEQPIALASWAPLIKRVMPTVVNVSVTQDVKTAMFSTGENGQGSGSGSGPFAFPFGNGGPFSSFPGFQFFSGQMPRQFEQHGIGSGLIVSPDGYILTNYHVVGDHPVDIKVTLMDKREFKAKVVGKDPKTDLALLKIDTDRPLPYASLGDSRKAQVGDWVLAIGNPFGFNLTATVGIVSAKGRALGGDYDNYIQTDAPINPGNSGGPLFNTSGQVIGINSAIYSSTGTNAGIGFAVPVDLARSIMAELKTHGRVIRGWLGVDVQTVTPELARSFGLKQPAGALVADVGKDTPAEKAGIRRGDIIVKFNDDAVKDEHDLPEIVAQTPIGKTVPVEVIRDGKHLTLSAKIGKLRQREVASTQGNDHPAAKLGLSVQTLTPQIAQELGIRKERGVVVTGVAPFSPAADAGLQTGDVILRLNHEKLASAHQFTRTLRNAENGKSSSLLLVQRGDRTLYAVINPNA